MAIVITINSVDRTSLVRKNSLNIQDILNSRNYCSFKLRDKTNTYKPQAGQSITIALDGVTIYAGTLDKIKEVIVKTKSVVTAVIDYDISCVDYNQICDRRRVAQVYDNENVGDIVKDIVDNFLDGENITYANVETGSVITKAVFTYNTVSQAFDELSELTGFDWYIDYTKDLHFFSRVSNLASTDLSDTNLNIQEMSIERNRELYRNRQYLRAGFDVTSIRTEYFVGNTKLTTFSTQFPIASSPTISQFAYVADDTTEAGTTTTNVTAVGHGLVTGDLSTNTTRDNAIRVITRIDDDNFTVSAITGQTAGDTIKKYTATAKTDGIRGVESGFDWYWNKSENEITQDDDGVLLTELDIMSVTYQGFYPIIALADSATDILERQTIEGGSGLYEDVLEDKSIESQDTAIEKAEGLLRRFGSIPERITILTFTAGYKAGQLVNIIQSDHGINGQYLIQSVRIKEYGLTYLYEILALSGENLGSWIDFFKRIIQQGQKYVIRENEVLLRIAKLTDSITLTDSLTFPADEEFSDSITLTDSLTPTGAAVESRVGFILVGYGEVG